MGSLHSRDSRAIRHVGRDWSRWLAGLAVYHVMLALVVQPLVLPKEWVGRSFGRVRWAGRATRTDAWAPRFMEAMSSDALPGSWGP